MRGAPGLGLFAITTLIVASPASGQVTVASLNDAEFVWMNQLDGFDLGRATFVIKKGVGTYTEWGPRGSNRQSVRCKMDGLRCTLSQTAVQTISMEVRADGGQVFYRIRLPFEPQNDSEKAMRRVR